MTQLAYLLVSITMFFWAGNIIAGKLAVGEVSPMLLNFLRSIICATTLGLFGFRYIAADLSIIKKHIGLMFLLALLGMTLFSISMFLAVQSTSATNVSIEQASMPLFIFIASYTMLRIRVSIGQILGFLISLGGVLAVVSHGEPARLAALEFAVGDAIMLVGVASYGLYTALLSNRPPMHWLTFIFMMTFCSALLGIPPVLFEAFQGNLRLPSVNGWMAAIYTAYFPSFVAQYCYISAISRLGSNRSGLFINMVPIFGTILSVVILGETLRSYHVIGLSLILGGIFLAEYMAPPQCRKLSPPAA